jgi:acetate---CoA ligase (ADP-forming)
MTLQNLFYPRGVAVSGSMAEGKLGYELVKQLVEGGAANVYACNPKGQSAFGVPAFERVSQIDRPVDLVVIASPAPTVAGVLRECGAAGVHAAVIISSGFSETGNHAGETEIMQIARQFGIRVVGPNCAGIVNTAQHLFATLETRPPAGKMAFISQSGALGGAVLSWAEEQGVGISKFVSYGNRADLDEIELLPYLAEDPETSVVALYIESVSDGRAFRQEVSQFTRKKPLVVIKAGRSKSGQRAALSHTGSMAGSDAVYDAVLAEAGAIRVASVEEMFDLCKGFASLPCPRGNKLAIVTNSGGPGILTADQAEQAGLEVGAISPELKANLKGFLPPNCALNNPVDLTVQGSGDQYQRTLAAVLGEFDAAVAINVATPYLDSLALARGIVAAAQSSGKAVAANFMAGPVVKESITFLESHGVPNFPSGERAAVGLAHMARYARQSANPIAYPTPPAAGGEPPRATGSIVLEPDAMAWLHRSGFPVPPFRFAVTEEEALQACQAIGFPVVMKVVSPEILHKSDFGGVILNIQDRDRASLAYAKLAKIAQNKSFCGVIVYPLVAKTQEIILGISIDPQFGPVILLGAGGIYTEILRDISIRLAPVSSPTAWEMIRELKSFPLLQGVRGQAGCDLDALAALISRVSELPFLFPQLSELDINPVFLLAQGALLGDIRVVLRR